MDNIFVVVMVFGFFAVPAALQHRVRFWGITGALLLRVAMIFLGVAPSATEPSSAGGPN